MRISSLIFILILIVVNANFFKLTYDTYQYAINIKCEPTTAYIERPVTPAEQEWIDTYAPLITDEEIETLRINGI